MKNLITIIAASTCLLCAGACSETDSSSEKGYVYVAPEVLETVQLKTNLSYKGDTCWFTIGYDGTLTKGKALPRYGRIKYQIVTYGIEPEVPVCVDNEQQLNLLSNSILSSNPEYSEWWKARYDTDMPENIIFFSIPENMSGASRKVEVVASVTVNEMQADEWKTMFSAVQDGNPNSQGSVLHTVIPFEHQRPGGNLIACDIDKGCTWQIEAGEEFSFEILDNDEYNEPNRTAAPRKEYSDEFLSVSMTGSRTCVLNVSKQDKPYMPISAHFVFYNTQNEVIEEFALIVCEDALKMDWQSITTIL